MVNTFLAHPDYVINAKLLDSRRLNKQITEATQIYNTCRKIYTHLSDTTYPSVWDLYAQARDVVKEHKIAWGNHPAVIMWLGYEDSLCEYIAACYNEWTTNRRRKDNTLCQYKNKPPEPRGEPCKPWWLYRTNLMLSHRVALINKERDRGEPAWYVKIKLFLDADATGRHREYVWPSKQKPKKVRMPYMVYGVDVETRYIYGFQGGTYKNSHRTLSILRKSGGIMMCFEFSGNLQDRLYTIIYNGLFQKHRYPYWGGRFDCDKFVQYLYSGMSKGVYSTRKQRPDYILYEIIDSTSCPPAGTLVLLTDDNNTCIHTIISTGVTDVVSGECLYLQKLGSVEVTILTLKESLKIYSEAVKTWTAHMGMGDSVKFETHIKIIDVQKEDRDLPTAVKATWLKKCDHN